MSMFQKRPSRPPNGQDTPERRTVPPPPYTPMADGYGEPSTVDGHREEVEGETVPLLT
jgi:hypothetical protein